MTVINIYFKSLPYFILLQVPDMKEIILIGFYQPNDELNRFISCAQQEFKIPIR